MKLIQELKKNPSVIAAYQFGSHGTAKQTPLSDIDICLFTTPISRQKLLQLSSYGTEKIDISIFDTLPIYVKPEVFKGTPLFVKDKYFVARQFARSFREYQDFRRYEEKYWKSMKRRFS